ncbi:unnamed protein product [Dibothriocephalus latus]|uniref:MARVEL domain-containing protein n=1 Tax=Dibothriocephalus latus TaxID=60516 RepID=A0A3P7MNV7_DIBLA|nr:unnamed protein product [Dibothriocephalus latus]
MAGLSTTAKIMKFVIVACNTLSFFSGLAIVILGILDFVHFETMFVSETLNLPKNIAIGAIVHGLVIIVAAFLGVFGALRANSNVLNAYAVFVLLIGCSTLCFLIYGFVQRNSHCETAIVYAIEAELGTIGGCLIGITLLSFFASGMGFLLARNIKAYEKV